MIVIYVLKNFMIFQKIVNYWETQLYSDYLDWREKIMQKISEKE